MDSQDSFMDDRMNLAAAYNRRKLDIVYNQTPIQPLQESYSPGQNIRLVFQRSKSVINLADVQLLFRPVICWSGPDALPDVARKSFLGITPTRASDFFQLTSLTFNNNQLLAQTSIAQTTPRTLFMNYYNSLGKKKKNTIGTEEYIAGVCTELAGGQLNQVVGTEEILMGTHPYVKAGNTIQARVDYDAFPRCIVSKCWTYNFEHALPATNGPTLTSNAYFSGTIDPLGSAGAGFNFGGVPMPAKTANNNAGESGDTVPYTSNFPLMPLMVTSSVAVYKQQQEYYQRVRMRFLTATTTVYPYVKEADAPIQTNTIDPIGMSTAADFASTFAMNLSAVGTIANQRVTYATSVQGPYGCGASASQNTPVRAIGRQWSAQNSTYFPSEQYTNMSCTLGELSIELDQIGNVCMDSTQVVALLQPSNPNQVLSAYLQTGLFMAPEKVKPAPEGAAQTYYTGASSAQCQQFLNSCLIGTASYKLTDLCCRIPYQVYPESQYSLIRSLLYQPVSFQSLRIQVDPILSLTSSMSQRIAIGGSALVNGCISFIVANPRILSNQTKPLRPQDTIINYQTLQPPCQNDLRYNCSDSLYVPFSQYSVFVGQDIYEASALIPISNQQFATYLKTQDAWFSIFGKHFNIPLRDFLHNRSCIAVGINQYNNREQMVSDQTIVITAQFSGADRIELSKTLGLQTQMYEPGSFSLYTVVVVSASLVNDDYVKI